MITVDGGMGGSETSGILCTWVVFGLVLFRTVSTYAVGVGAVFLCVIILEAFRVLGIRLGYEVVNNFAISVEEG